MRARPAMAMTAIGLSAALAVLTGCSTDAPDSTGAAVVTSAPVVASSASAARSSPTAAASPTPAAVPTGSYQEQLLAYGRQLALCARAHGLPNFPDPNGVEFTPGGIGDPRFPGLGKEDLVTAMDRCPEIIRRIPHPPPPGPPSAATLQKMRQYAQCLREHGLNGFPDPRADGTFPIRGTRYAGLAAFYFSETGGQLPADQVSADNACRHYEVNWYVRAS
jgi:hypothetical protein